MLGTVGGPLYDRSSARDVEDVVDVDTGAVAQRVAERQSIAAKPIANLPEDLCIRVRALVDGRNAICPLFIDRRYVEQRWPIPVEKPRLSA